MFAVPLGGCFGKIAPMQTTTVQGRLTDILMIDDSLTDLRLLMDLMTSRRMRVSAAFDGTKGYRQAELLQPGLILLDVRMPGMDGFATCRHLKENPKTRLIPVIFLTAATEVSERLQGFSVGAVDYIGKPFIEQEVLARIAVHLDLTKRVASYASMDAADEIEGSTSFDAILVANGQKILRQHISSPPSLDGLAAQLGTNRRRINEAFQIYCGLSVFNWLREDRLRQAHYLVANTDTPISYLAEYLGFSTPANFSKAFKERYHCSPRSLRQEMQNSRALDGIETP
jgi:DNA-binding response OmpR family regulator